MPSVDISEETYHRLAERAAALNITVEDLVRPALEGLVPKEAMVQMPLTGEAWKRAFDALTKEIESQAGRYPPNFRVDDSREAIYGEREDHQL
jgi:hypothetical protein